MNPSPKALDLTSEAASPSVSARTNTAGSLPRMTERCTAARRSVIAFLYERPFTFAMIVVWLVLVAVQFGRGRVAATLAIIAGAFTTTFAIHWIRSERGVAWLRDVFGEVELSVGYWCAICADVHEQGTKCIRAMTGRCVECNRRVALDRFGMCPRGHREIVRRRLRYPDARKRGTRA